MPLVSFSPGQVISSANVDANFALCVLTDTSRTVTVTHTWTSTQTFTGGWTAAAACTISAGGIAVTGNSMITGSLSAVTALSMSGTLTMSQAVSKIVPGATSLSLRNNADTFDNLILTDAGVATFRARINLLPSSGLQFTAVDGGCYTGGNEIFLGDYNAATKGIRVNFSTGAVRLTHQLTFDTAASKIVPGATSFSHRNNADSADNLLITDAGDVTVRARLIMATSSAKCLIGATQLDFRDSADSLSRFLVSGSATVSAQVSNGRLNTAATTIAYASLLIPSGTAPSTPVDGEMWYNGTSLFFRNGGTTKTITWA